MKILLVYNPTAQYGKARKRLSKIQALFERQQIETDLRLTAYRGHAKRLVQSADFSEYDGIVAAGGDGTLFEVINGYFENDSPARVPIGVLPIGTGNALSREFGLDARRSAEAVAIIGRRLPKKLDVGKLQTAGQTYYFLGVVGIGFITEAMTAALRVKALGNLSYTLGILYRLLFLKSYVCSIELDGRIFKRDTVMLAISNGRYTANFRIAPDAMLDDGMLDVRWVRKCSRLRLSWLFGELLAGSAVNAAEVETLRARHIQVRADEPLILGVDGELLGCTPLEIECLPQAIEVFV